jgi:hypothetical protein
LTCHGTLWKGNGGCIFAWQIKFYTCVSNFTFIGWRETTAFSILNLANIRSPTWFARLLSLLGWVGLYYVPLSELCWDNYVLLWIYNCAGVTFCCWVLPSVYSMPWLTNYCERPFEGMLVWAYRQFCWPG